MVSEVYVMVVIEGVTYYMTLAEWEALKATNKDAKSPKWDKSVLTHILGNMSNHKYPIYVIL